MWIWWLSINVKIDKFKIKEINIANVKLKYSHIFAFYHMEKFMYFKLVNFNKFIFIETYNLKCKNIYYYIKNLNKHNY